MNTSRFHKSADFTVQGKNLRFGGGNKWREFFGRSHSPFPVFKTHLCSTVCGLLKCEAHKKRFIIEATRHIKSGCWRPWRFKGVQGGWPEASQTQLIGAVLLLKKGFVVCKRVINPAKKQCICSLCNAEERFQEKVSLSPKARALTPPSWFLFF